MLISPCSTWNWPFTKINISCYSIQFINYIYGFYGSKAVLCNKALYALTKFDNKNANIYFHFRVLSVSFMEW